MTEVTRWTIVLTIVLLAALLLANLIASIAPAHADDVYIPVVVSETGGIVLPPDGGDTELWLAFLELATHCVVYDELMDCAEFPHAAALTANRCWVAQSLAQLTCIVIGAPIDTD